MDETQKESGPAFRRERELDPDFMYASIDEKTYKPELELFDRWQAFSTELLRLALLGIAIFGFLYQQVFARFDAYAQRDVPLSLVKTLSQVSLLLFALSAVGALLYRYGSTEAIMHYVWGLKSSSEKESELGEREWWLRRCLVFKIISAVSLGFGAISATAAIFKLL